VGETSTWGFAEGEELHPGRHVSRLLGGGRRYEAYLVWDDALHALVVVKILRPAVVDSPGPRSGFASEARALAALSHPIVVRSFDAVLDGDRPHLVLEYLDGPRLSTLVRRYGVIVEQLLPLALELCSALHYIHGRGFLHLDVKPRNIVMSARPRLIDLSIAAPIEDARDTTEPVGTDAYMAPEQCDPERFSEIGPRTDIWGLGVTMFEALARRRPFAAAEDVRFPQLISSPGPLPKDIPAPLAEAIMACLEPQPLARPSAAELAATVEPWAAALPRPRLGLFRAGGRTQQSAYAVG
jgi:eukaryotic-like serine/threonine-protein kinase